MPAVPSKTVRWGKRGECDLLDTVDEEMLRDGGQWRSVHFTGEGSLEADEPKTGVEGGQRVSASERRPRRKEAERVPTVFGRSLE